MNFVARFTHTRSQEDISYYVAELGTPTIFESATDRLYFVVSRLQLTRIGPTMRGEILSEVEAEGEIAALREAPDWQEMDAPVE